MTAPDPFREIRLLSVRALRGANFWSTGPVTRLDLAVGAYDDLSSADVPGFGDSLEAALPGLVEHRCSVGERGGFLARLRRGTYAPHVVEHLALELQSLVGHDVGYGRARGGDREGEYTVVFEHLHSGVGALAGRAAVELTQRAFARLPLAVEEVVARLRAAAAAPDPPRPQRRVRCAVTGRAADAVLDELLRLGEDGEEIVAVDPAGILDHGLPYARSDLAVVVDADPGDVPPRYRDPERARRLLGVVAGAVREGGVVVVPEANRALRDLVRAGGREVAAFSGAGDARAAAALAHSLLAQAAVTTRSDGAKR